jgi:hypothetical protein
VLRHVLDDINSKAHDLSIPRSIQLFHQGSLEVERRVSDSEYDSNLPRVSGVILSNTPSQLLIFKDKAVDKQSPKVQVRRWLFGSILNTLDHLIQLCYAIIKIN